MEADKSTTILMARDISKEESIAHANILMGTATETISDLESPVHSCVESILRSDGDDDDEDLIFQEVKMILRKRRGWGPEDSLSANDLDLLEYDDELVEEDDAGCPLPSTPEDTQLIEAEVSSFCCLHAYICVYCLLNICTYVFCLLKISMCAYTFIISF